MLATTGCGGGDDPGDLGTGGTGGTGGAGGTGGDAGSPEICDNGLDDDGDGHVDCDDADCAAAPSCLCGNGVVDAGEDCDGPELDGNDCLSQGFDGGDLACTDACTFDVTSCTRVEICDNGTDDDGDGDVDCDDADCREDEACLCGNGLLDPGEECDGAELDGKSCESLGYATGDLACTDACRLDETDCRYPDEVCDNGVDDDRDGDTDCDDADCATTPFCLCGNGVLDDGEECDGDLFGDASCVTLDYEAGELACNDNCTIDSSDCRLVEDCTDGIDDDGDGLTDCWDPECAEHPACNVCGDDRADPEELCDGTDLRGEDCVSQGFAGGTLACTDCAAFDTSDCHEEEICTGGVDEDRDGLVDCADPDCADAEGCEPDADCATAIVATGNDLGSLRDGPAAMSGSCGTPGKEQIYVFTPGEAGQVGNLQVELVPSGNLAFHVRTTCHDPETELACVNEHADNRAESADLMVRGGEPVYVIVDSPSTSASYDFRLELDFDVCGNGQVVGYEECDPPNGGTCNANCLIAEADCSDFADNDGDGLFDCQDPVSCRGLDPVCIPGTGAVGAACTAHSDCASAVGDDPICWREEGTGHPSGLCSEACDLESSDCPTGSACVDVGRENGTGACYPTCTIAADCPNAGYRCAVPEGGSAAVCLPGCTSDDQCVVTGRCDVARGLCVTDEVCDNQLDDDHDGLADCDDDDCSDHWHCLPPESDCANLLDDDNDGAIDCRDETACRGTAACIPGTGAVGSPCTAPSDCASAVGEDPACLPSVASGYCTELCDLGGTDCPAGTACVDRSIALGQSLPPSPVGVCMNTCTTAEDCGEGWTCATVDPGSVQLCMPMEDCGNGFDDDFDGAVDCADLDCIGTPECLPPECPAAIPAQDTNSGTTVGGSVEHHATGCAASGNAGAEVIYQYSPNAPGLTGSLNIKLQSSKNHGIYVRSDCTDPSTELACRDSVYSGTETIFLPVIHGHETIFVFVDTSSTNHEGPFTLSFEFGYCGDGVQQSFEDCDDGNTVDGDSCPSTCVLPLESEPNDSIATADPWVPGFRGTSFLEDSEDWWDWDNDYVYFSVPGPSSTVIVEVQDGGTGACARGELDSVLYVLDGNRTTLGNNDDIDSTNLCSRVEVVGLAAGIYYARVETGDANLNYRGYDEIDYVLDVIIR